MRDFISFSEIPNIYSRESSAIGIPRLPVAISIFCLFGEAIQFRHSVGKVRTDTPLISRSD